MPGYQCANWIGLVAPAGTPDAVTALLHKELATIQDSPELKKQFAGGRRDRGMSSAEFGGFIASETTKWGRVAKEAASSRNEATLSARDAGHGRGRTVA